LRSLLINLCVDHLNFLIRNNINPMSSVHNPIIDQVLIIFVSDVCLCLGLDEDSVGLGVGV
jgi:hypothetical protein